MDVHGLGREAETRQAVVEAASSPPVPDHSTHHPAMPFEVLRTKKFAVLHLGGDAMPAGSESNGVGCPEPLSAETPLSKACPHLVLISITACRTRRRSS